MMASYVVVEVEGDEAQQPEGEPNLDRVVQ